MATPRPHELKLYFASKDLAADGDPLPVRTVADDPEANTVRAVRSADLDESDGYWNGAIGWFTADTPTVPLRGHFFHVRASTAQGVLTAAKNFPAAPRAEDRFVLACGGGRRSAQELFGMTLAGQQPEFQPFAHANLPGVKVTKVSPILGETTLTLAFASATRELFLKAGGGANGPGVFVGDGVADWPVYEENERGFLRVSVEASALPTTDRSIAVTAAQTRGTFVPDVEGYETGQGTFPKYRYHPLVLRNTAEEDPMVALSTYADRYSTASGALTGATMGTGIGRCTLSSGEASWPANSFWVRNTTRNAARYVKFRSGKELACAASGAFRGLASQSWYSGDAVEVMSDIDLGMEYPNAETGAFGSPANVYAAPANVTFSAADTEARSVQLDDLAAGQSVVLWLRETIVQDHRSRNDVNGNLRFAWS